jgi:hypothetical protein
VALRSPSLRTGDRFSTDLGIREHAQEEYRARQAAETGQARSMLDWATLLPERGVPLNFERFPFQRDWYSEEVARAAEVIWKKAAQIGMSANSIRWAMRRAEQFGDRVIYFFPTDDDVTNFGDQRIEPSIQESEYLLRRIPAHYVRNKHLKRIGRGDLSLRGTQSKAAVQSVDADALVFDEYDYLHQANLAQAERRIAGAVSAGRTPRIRRLGYPTLPGFGIDALYARSDRREWHVECPGCGDVQRLEWGANVRWRSRYDDEVHHHGHDEYADWRDVSDAWRACRRCGESLEVDGHAPIKEGRWIPLAAGSDLIGFHASRLIVPYTDLIELVRNSRKSAASDVEAFYNNDLGLAYVPAEAALSEQDIQAACAYGKDAQTQALPQQVTVLGVDVASERDLTAWVDELSPDGRQRAVWLGEPRDFDEVVDLIRRFRPVMTVIDGLPERRQARAVAATYPGVVSIAAYDHRFDADAFKYDPKKNLVTINRTEALDAFMDGVRQARRIPLRQPPPRFVSQLMSPKRRTELDSKERPVRVYVSTGPDGDDYAHAGVYALVAKEMYLLRVQVEQATLGARGSAVADERLGFRPDAFDRFQERY